MLKSIWIMKPQVGCFFSQQIWNHNLVDDPLRKFIILQFGLQYLKRCASNDVHDVQYLCFCGTLSETLSALSMSSFLTAKSHKLCKLSWKDWFAAKADFSLAFPQHTQCIQTGHTRIMNKKSPVFAGMCRSGPVKLFQPGSIFFQGILPNRGHDILESQEPPIWNTFSLHSSFSPHRCKVVWSPSQCICNHHLPKNTSCNSLGHCCNAWGHTWQQKQLVQRYWKNSSSASQLFREFQSKSLVLAF